MGRIGLRQYILLAVLALLLGTVSIYVVQKTILTEAAPGINKTINFQGKMTDDDGLNVPNGTYQFVFNMYTVASGGSSTWTETVNLSVTDGIFHHNLGSSTALPGSVDFDTDNIYLGITFNSDPDGEMSPRIQLTASPYAFNSDQLDGLDASEFLQISPSGAQTGNIAITGSVSAGSLVLSDGSSNTGTIQMSSISSNYIYSIPSTTGNDTFCLYSLANCANPNSFVQNGNSFTAAAVLGTNDAYALQFETQNNVRMTIASNGNTTVGSASDIGQFGIVNDTTGDIALTVRGAGSQSANLQEWQNSSSTALTSISARGSLSINTALYSNGDTALDINNSGTTLFRITKNSSNGTLLVLPSSTSGVAATVRGLASQSGNLQEWQNSSSSILASISSAGNFMTTGTASVGSNLTVDTNTFFVNATTNRVGIGNTSPNAALEVTGDIYLTREAARTIKLADSTTAATAGAAFSILGANGNGANGGALTIAAGNSGGLNTGGSVSISGGSGLVGGNVNITGGSSGFSAGNVVLQSSFTLGYDGNLVASTSKSSGFGYTLSSTNAGANGLAAVVASTSSNQTAFRAAGGSGFGSGLSVLANGYVGINDAAPVNRLGVSALTTADTSAQVAISTAGTTNKGLIIQGVASQTADLFQAQSSAGTTLTRLDANGNLYLADTSMAVLSGSDGLFVVNNVDNRVGIGIPSWATLDYSYQAYLNASTTQSVASYQYAQLGGSTTLSQTAYEFNMGLTNPSATSFQTHTNMKSFMSLNLTANTANNNFVGINSSGYIAGSGTAESITGMHVDIGPSADGAVNNLYGIRVNNGTGSGATVGNRQGVRIEDAWDGGSLTDNYGLYIAEHDAGTNNYGLYIQGADTYALFVDDGASRLDGTLTVGSTITYTAGAADTNTAVCQNAAGQLAGCTSASRFKDDVQDLALGLDELRLLQPVSYTWNTNGRADIGFLAEQVASVIPQAVTYDEFGEISSFNYNTISALLVSSTKQLDVKVNSSDERLNSLEARLVVLEQSKVDPTSLPTLTVSGNVSIGGRLVVGGKIITGGSIPTASAAVGTASVSGNDTAGELSFTSGSNSSDDALVSVVFGSGYGSQPRVLVSPTNQNAANAKYYVERDAAGFRVKFVEAPDPGQEYKFDYLVVQ